MLHLDLERRLRAAVAAVLPDADAAAVQVRPCPDPKFGDYQSNSLMALAKARRLNPRQLATEELANEEMSGLFEAVVEGTEEAIYNSLFMATTVTARGGTVEALPVAEVVRIVGSHGMLRR